MVPYLSERENAVEHINAICTRLFDRWRESRRLMPLTYLLRGWPLINSDAEAFRRLGGALRELRRHPLHGLDRASFQQLCELSDCVDDLLVPSAPATWAAHNG